MSLWSDVGDNVDYYFIHGTNMDEVIAGYRELTGQAPMYGKWAYGYWQSKEHYKTRDELLDIAREYRQRQIPIDNHHPGLELLGRQSTTGAACSLTKPSIPIRKKWCNRSTT